jgi:hypothetical protein
LMVLMLLRLSLFSLTRGCEGIGKGLYRGEEARFVVAERTRGLDDFLTILIPGF